MLCNTVDGRPQKEIGIVVESRVGSRDFDEVGGRGKGTVRRRIPFFPFFSDYVFMDVSQEGKGGSPGGQRKMLL